jgi:tight adherence protein B
MSEARMNALFAAVLVLACAAVLLLIEGVYLWWRDAHAARVARRLRTLGTAPAAPDGGRDILKRRAMSRSEPLARVLARLPGTRWLDGQLLQAGKRRSVAWLLRMSLLACAAGWTGAAVLRPGWALPAGLLGALLPFSSVVRARGRRIRQVERQLPEAAEMISRALRAGHAFSTALQMAGDEMPEPLAAEFRIVVDEVKFGVTMQDALHNLAGRVPLPDFRYLVIAILVQREAGGNLTEILDSIARVIRARLHLRGEIRTLSAEGRMSAWVLAVLPFGVALAMQATNPAYVGALWQDPLGMRMVQGGLALMAAGIVWMRAIIRIRV